MLDKDVLLQTLKLELQQLYGPRLAKLILFGSYARNEQREDSDVDILVVLHDEKIQTGAELRRMNKLLFNLDLQFQTNVSALPTTVSRLASDSLFYQNVRRDGTEL